MPLLLIALILFAAPAHAEIAGLAVVIDGDMLQIGDQRIQLYGTDAPEGQQTCLGPEGGLWPCGQQASLALSEKIGDRPVTCIGRERASRIPAAVCVVDGEDLNGWMVANGWALSHPENANDYADHEIMARATRAGIWRGQFVAPWEWRRSERGDIADTSKQLYRCPSSRSCSAAAIMMSRGEHWFRSKEEAGAMGWRAAPDLRAVAP
jgi:endonuclease YncB( thermonuclease family)